MYKRFLALFSLIVAVCFLGACAPAAIISPGNVDTTPILIEVPTPELTEEPITPQPTIGATPVIISPVPTEVMGFSPTPDITVTPEVTATPGSDEQQGTRKRIALTFDDGPARGSTDRILDTLELYGQKATFFVIGERVDMYPDRVLRAYSLGCEIGNHTYTHPILTKLTDERILEEINSTFDSLSKLGIESNLYRPPGGRMDKEGHILRLIGRPCILWSLDTRDWESRDKDAVIEAVLSNVRDGDIVLMHDLYASTADAVEYLIPELLNRGFELVTVSELYGTKGIDLDAQIYRHAR